MTSRSVVIVSVMVIASSPAGKAKPGCAAVVGAFRAIWAQI
jgi:hypothetical protein